MNPDIVKAMFAAADERIPEALTAFFTDDICFRFGSNPAVNGIGPVEAMLAAFYDYVREMRHEIVGIHCSDDVWAVETIAFYVDMHGRSFSFPACNLMTAEGDKFSQYKIFVDNSAMFQPPA